MKHQLNYIHWDDLQTLSNKKTIIPGWIVNNRKFIIITKTYCQ